MTLRRVTRRAQARAGGGSALAYVLQRLGGVWRTTKRHWHELRSQRAGRRFQAFYEEHATHRSGWARYLTLAAGVVSFVIGVVLAFIPGPAVVFFALTGALASTQSRWVARKLDRSELYAHALWRKFQRRRRERQAKRALLHPKNDATTVVRKEQRGRNVATAVE